MALENLEQLIHLHLFHYSDTKHGLLLKNPNSHVIPMSSGVRETKSSAHVQQKQENHRPQFWSPSSFFRPFKAGVLFKQRKTTPRFKWCSFFSTSASGSVTNPYPGGFEEKYRDPATFKGYDFFLFPGGFFPSHGWYFWGFFVPSTVRSFQVEHRTRQNWIWWTYSSTW